MRFFAGYPITPSTEIAEILAERLPRVGGTFVQMEDEISSMAAVIGASLTGVKAMTATSGPGFSLKQENIGFAAFTEVPCVIVNVQRKGPSTGMPTSPAQGDVMQARWGTHGDHPVIALTPFSVLEAFTLTVEAFNLAEKYRVPVILLMDEVIAHMRERVELPGPEDLEIVDRRKPAVKPGEYYPYDVEEEDGVPPMAVFGEGYRFHVTGLYHDAMGYPATGNPRLADQLIRRLVRKIEGRVEELTMVDEVQTEDAKVVVVAYGSVARSAARAVRLAREEGYRVGLFRPKIIWPFPAPRVRKLAARVEGLIVTEMNMGQVFREVERAVQGMAKVDLVSRVDGELITPVEVLTAIKEVY